jgi:hypothetical protein
MKKEHLLGILLFGGLWGLSESVLGDALFSAGVPHASVYLAGIAFLILAMASRFVPQRGSATAIACLAMLYKFLNVPFFACHLTGIALVGVGYDLVFSWRRAVTGAPDRTARADHPPLLAAGLKAVVACYAGRILFYLAMVFVFRSESWLKKGIDGLVRYLGVGGILAAAACAVAVPVGLVLGRRLREWVSGGAPLRVQPRLTGLLATAATVGIWAYGLAAKLMRG